MSTASHHSAMESVKGYLHSILHNVYLFGFMEGSYLEIFRSFCNALMICILENILEASIKVWMIGIMIAHDVGYHLANFLTLVCKHLVSFLCQVCHICGRIVLLIVIMPIISGVLAIFLLIAIPAFCLSDVKITPTAIRGYFTWLKELHAVILNHLRS